MITDDWRNCYRDGWSGLIVPDAFTHPAKFSRNLIARIYDHCRDQDWLTVGDTVLDPFGGVALGALDAMRLGCSWVGIELEEKFVRLGEQNIALWHRRYHRLPNWGMAKLLQGDSRKLLAWGFAGRKAECVVGSPPYSASETTTSIIGETREEWYAKRNSEGRRYSKQNPSNLGNLPDHGFDAAIGSPPFLAQERGAGLAKPDATYAKDGHKFGANHGYQNQGSSPGQLAAMPEGAFEACVSSPPWENSLYEFDQSRTDGLAQTAKRPWMAGMKQTGNYGSDSKNIGNSYGDTFWLAARQILEQVHVCLKPGGHAVWVVKHYVREGKLVDFPGQWRKLCEAVGFRTLHCHRAWLVEDNGTHLTMDGEEQRLTTERKSFFRRLAEQKGAPRIDWESVWCMERQ